MLLGLGVALAVRGPGVNLRVGIAAPQLRLATLQGEVVDLAPYRGKPLLLNFFATWCTPCRMEIPGLNKVHASLGDEVAVVGVLVFSGMPGEETRTQVAQMGPVYPVWVSDDESAAAWQVSAVPVTVLLDSQGVVKWVSAGLVTEGEVRDAVHAVLKPTAMR